MPALMHHAAQSNTSEPTDPSGEGKIAHWDYVLPEEKKMIHQAERVDSWTRRLVPHAYLFIWVTLTLGYFLDWS